ncbi:alpha/beta hydrolase [Roseomonas chloroacetimidivorans]|uniref:alpha/beta hydrolase n=1 Tax=Roseomonas chloroacetimidivorans TaxID=1766656 RepID=UPI003C7937F7
MAEGGGPLRIAEQGGFWVGVTRTSLPHGTAAAGQMYVQYQLPAERRHALPLVLVHGGGGQGTDYLTTPDGRPGWASYFLRRGFAVYVVDRPSLGRSPYHADIYGPATPPPTYEALLKLFVAPERYPDSYPQARLHTQWPGGTEPGDPVLDQFMAPLGASLAELRLVHEHMRRCGAALLDRIGPAVLLTHSAGGPFGWLAADARPEFVKAIVAIEPLGPPFARTLTGGLDWGLTAVPLSFDPPAPDPSAMQPELRAAPGADLKLCMVQAEPARQLPRLSGIPIVVVTAEASWKAQEDHGVVDFLRQAGVPADHLRLEQAGIHGNGHMVMLERNSDEIAALLADWIERCAGMPQASQDRANEETKSKRPEQLSRSTSGRKR